MLVFLRFIGLINASIWLGVAVAVVAGAGPAFASGEMLRILPPSHATAAEQIMVRRLLWIEYGCAAVALAHLLAEWIYGGRLLKRPLTACLVGLATLVLSEGQWVHPKMERAHLDIYGTRSTPAQKEAGRKQFALWWRTAQTINLLVSLGLVVYVWNVTTPGPSPRFAGNKFWG